MRKDSARLCQAGWGGGTVGFGPFVVGGGYSSGKTERNFDHHYTAEGLVCPGVQLLGYVSTILPASPKVDSKEYMKGVQAKGAAAPR